MKKPVYALFVDLSAAFDHVRRKWMFKSIINRHSKESDKKLVQLLETLYEYTTTALTETPGDKFKLSTGVRQGGPHYYITCTWISLCEYIWKDSE